MRLEDSFDNVDPDKCTGCICHRILAQGFCLVTDYSSVIVWKINLKYLCFGP